MSAASPWMSPDQANGDGDVAGREVLGVVVAGELADLAALPGLLDLGGRGLRVGHRGIRWILAQAEHHQADGVPHLGQHGDLTLELRVEDVVDAGQLTPGLLRVVADAGHAREPRHAVLATRIEAHVLHVVDQVRLVRELGVVERGDVAELDQAAGHPVGEHDDVAVDALVPLERLVDLREELVVVVDVLGVLGLDARGLLEVGHRLLVDVERPVGDPERLAAASGRRGRRVAAARGGAFLAAATGGQQTVPEHQSARARARFAE